MQDFTYNRVSNKCEIYARFLKPVRYLTHNKTFETPETFETIKALHLP